MVVDLPDGLGHLGAEDFVARRLIGPSEGMAGLMGETQVHMMTLVPVAPSQEPAVQFLVLERDSDNPSPFPSVFHNPRARSIHCRASPDLI